MKQIIQIYLTTIKNKKWFFLTLTLISVALVFTYAAIWPGIKSQTVEMNSIIAAMPTTILKAFNIGTNFNDDYEYLLISKQFSLVLPVLILILTNGLAGSAIAKAIDDGTILLYLTQPISRAKYYWSKYFAGLILTIIFSILSVIIAVPFGRIFGIDSNLSHYITYTIEAIFFGWSIYSIGFCASAIFNNTGMVTAITVGFFLLSYIFNVVAQLSDKLINLKYFSLIYYYGPSIELVRNSILIFSFIAVSFSILGSALFNQRDISIK